LAAQHPDSVVVWCLTDGKAGHANQAQGLLASLRELVPIDAHTLPVTDIHMPLWSLLSGRFAAGRELPDPDLILGAGRATHLPMLAARRARGGRAVVLMKPGLPLSWFDLCIIPAHDRPRPLANVLQTTGVLNRVRFQANKDPAAGLFLVGGPSPHVDWSSEAILGQISQIVEQSPAIHWQLATSRRTPDELVNLLHRRPAAQLTVVPAAATGPDWLPQQLAAASVVWVSEDSVSMVYEALTSGAAVGLLSVPYRKANDRLAGGLRKLLDDGLVTDYEGWRHGRELQPPAVPLDEAGRCAEWIAGKWLASG
jgi:hypothetical protein